MEAKIGTIKTQISEFTIRDNEIARIIKDALKQQGFDLEVKPVIDVSTQFFIGEEFKVFRTE
ncbi:hypothetical protein [Clostridium pasteurianum]|uniref:Uncharacterized protein n=1 Tax=Clostridium pasteurianum BC1 TaxID=86416 RepID=R4JYL3_CLOPA|nr:hypothetical protein [Clostridium pasteurianum]AGK95388.1 hypothetical protein Clopa_0326 [Clostridium pasteurianum BC1]